MNTNPRRPSRYGQRPTRGASSGRPQGGRGRGRRGRPDAPPVFMGEPSPSLAKINAMNMAKLEEKIASLKNEQEQLATRLDRLKAMPEPPTEKIQSITVLQERLAALMAAASERLAGKAERKAAREQRGG